MVFADATYKLHRDMKPSAPSTGTQPSGHFCLDEKLRVRLPGPGKNHATATLTATNQTAGPLEAIQQKNMGWAKRAADNKLKF